MKYKSLFIQGLLVLLFTMLSSTVYGVEEGKNAPVITLPSLYDKQQQISLADFKGKVVYVDFWASWCGPCRKSLPQLNELRNHLLNEGKEFEVLAVNLDNDLKEASAFIKKYPVSYPVVYDSKGKYPELYGVVGMPTSYLLDQQGRVNYVHTGFKTSDIEKLEHKVRGLLR